MLKRSLATLTVLLLTTSAHADEPPTTLPGAATAAQAPATPAPPSVPVEATAPITPVAPSATTLAPVRLPPAFMDRFLSYDDEAAVARKGRARQELSREDLYLELNRPDLVEKSREATRRRLIFGIAGATVLLAGVATAVVARAGMPDLHGADFCSATVHNYNDICVPDARRREVVSAASLIGGISLGGLLGMLSYENRPNVLSKDETSSLISQHNAALLKRLRDEKGQIRFTPYASAQGAGVVTAFTF